MNSEAKIKKALFVQLGGLGDLLLSVPAMKALKREYGAVTRSLCLTGRLAACNHGGSCRLSCPSFLEAENDPDTPADGSVESGGCRARVTIPKRAQCSAE